MFAPAFMPRADSDSRSRDRSDRIAPGEKKAFGVPDGFAAGVIAFSMRALRRAWARTAQSGNAPYS